MGLLTSLDVHPRNHSRPVSSLVASYRTRECEWWKFKRWLNWCGRGWKLKHKKKCCKDSDRYFFSTFLSSRLKIRFFRYTYNKDMASRQDDTQRARSLARVIFILFLFFYPVKHLGHMNRKTQSVLILLPKKKYFLFFTWVTFSFV